MTGATSLEILNRYLPLRPSLADAGASVLALGPDPTALGSMLDTPYTAATAGPIVRTRPGITAIRYDGPNLPLKSGAFHTVVSMEPLPRIARPGYLSDLARIAAARVILSFQVEGPPGAAEVPVIESGLSVMPGWWWWAAPAGRTEAALLGPLSTRVYVLERRSPMRPLVDPAGPGSPWLACACPACGGDIEAGAALVCLACARSFEVDAGGGVHLAGGVSPAPAPVGAEVAFVMAPRWLEDAGWVAMLHRYLRAIPVEEPCCLYLLASPAEITLEEAWSVLRTVLEAYGQVRLPTVVVAADPAVPARAGAHALPANPDDIPEWTSARFRDRLCQAQLAAALRRVTAP